MVVEDGDVKFEQPRVQLRDRPWIGSEVSTLCGPCDMPSVAELEQAIAALGQRYPHCRLGWGLDGSKRHWLVPQDRSRTSFGAVVVERSRAGHTSLGETLDTMVHDRSVEAPLAVFRYENYFGLRMSHEYGDGRFYDQAIGAIMAAASKGTVSWDIGPTTRFPLASAVLRTFGTAPQRALAAVADRPKRSAQEPAPPGRTMVNWAPARKTVSAVIPNDLREQMIQWGHTAAPGASWFSLLVSMLLRSMEVAGMRVAEDLSIVMDLRRFLKSRDLDGNFVVGVPFNVTFRTPPAELGSAIRSAVASGRPVAGAASSALWGLRRGTTPATVDPERLPRVTFTSVGAPPRINSLPYLDGQPATCAGSVEPHGPHGLTFLISETPQACVVTASFHENVIDPAVVQDALRLAHTEPVEILAKW